MIKLQLESTKFHNKLYNLMLTVGNFSLDKVLYKTLCSNSLTWTKFNFKQNGNCS